MSGQVLTCTGCSKVYVWMGKRKVMTRNNYCLDCGEIARTRLAQRKFRGALTDADREKRRNARRKGFQP